MLNKPDNKISLSLRDITLSLHLGNNLNNEERYPTYLDVTFDRKLA